MTPDTFPPGARGRSHDLPKSESAPIGRDLSHADEGSVYDESYYEQKESEAWETMRCFLVYLALPALAFTAVIVGLTWAGVL